MDEKKIKDNRGFSAISAIAATILAVSAVIISSVSSAAELEEIVVTAQKRAQSVQDIGFSVSAFDTQDAARFANDIGALAGQSPGVESYGNNSYFQSFFIRGVGLNEFSGNYNPPVAVHNDEVYVSKNWATARPSFDIERIEILKGPQGTIFGRNTTGGAVNYYTNAPTAETDAYVRASVDEHSRYSLEGAVSGALSDNLNGRLSFYRGFGSGGPQFNEFTGDDHGEPDLTEVRAQLEWAVSEATTIRALVYGGDDQSELQAYKSPGIFNDVRTGAASGFCPEILSGAAHLNPASCTKFTGVLSGDNNEEYEPNDIHTVNQNNAPEKDDDFAGGYLRVEHGFGNFQLTSITSYDDYKRYNQEDADGTPIQSNDVYYRNELELFSQEIRLNGTAVNEQLNYVGGFYYSDEDLFQSDLLLFSQSPFGIPLSGQFGNFEQTVESIALYFNANYDLSEKFTLSFGGRYTEDKTDIDAMTGVILPDGVTRISVDMLVDTRTDDDTSWRLGLSYHFNDATLLYANLATSFRTGGYSVPFGGSIVEFEEENVESIELGFKSDISGTVRLNAAVFFYNYDDRQVNVDDPVSPIVPITRNIEESEVFGLEADFTWLASDNVRIKLGYAYLDAEFTEASRSVTTISSLGPIPLQGNVPVNAPEHQFNGSFEYSDAINEKLNWSGYLDFRWVDERFLEVTNQPADTADSYAVVNATLGIQSADGVWDASMWVKNLTDEKYLTYINNLPGPGFALDVFGEQRTIGATVGYKF